MLSVQQHFEAANSIIIRAKLRPQKMPQDRRAANQEILRMEKVSDAVIQISIVLFIRMKA